MMENCIPGPVVPNNEVNGETAHCGRSKIMPRDCQDAPDWDTCPEEKPKLPSKPNHVPPPYKDPPYPLHNKIGLRPAAAPPPHEGRPPSPLLPGAMETVQHHGYEVLPCHQSRTITDSGLPATQIPTLSQMSRRGQQSAQPCAPSTKVQAWTQEEKASRPNNDRLGSLQNRLRSLLIHGPSEAKDRPGNEHNRAENGSVRQAESSCNLRDNLSFSVPEQLHMRQALPRQCLVKSEENLLHGDQGPQANASTANDVDDSVNLRDTCNKLFGRSPCWNTYMRSYHGQTHNINTAYTCDKVMPKEAIGKMCHSTPKPPDLISTKPPSNETAPKGGSSLPDGDVGSDPGKSSSESGRGTMRSGFVTPKSFHSVLDSSLDSDHSSAGAQWQQPSQEQQTGLWPSSIDKELHSIIGENQNTKSKVELSQDVGFGHDGTCSESTALSLTPPLPPLTPPRSPSPTYKSLYSGGVLQAACRNGESTKHRTNTGCKAKSGTMHPQQASYKLWDTKGKHPIAMRSCQKAPHHNYKNRTKAPRIPLGYNEALDGDVTSTTTALDGESLFEDDSSDVSFSTTNTEGMEVVAIRKQLEGLESMYSEILKLLGVKSGSGSRAESSYDLSRSSRRRLHQHGSMNSLTGRSSISRATGHREKRTERRRSTKETKTSPVSKRLQRLESHVVTLARSVAHLSSEMRTQHILVQEIENVRRDVSWLHDQVRHFQGGKGHHQRDFERFRNDVLQSIHPARVQKLTKFFGAEPPLLRQFLKKLGYEKYASNFESEKIGLMELPYLTEERLQKIGIPMGPRLRILQEAQQSFRHDHLKIYIV